MSTGHRLKSNRGMDGGRGAGKRGGRGTHRGDVLYERKINLKKKKVISVKATS